MFSTKIIFFILIITILLHNDFCCANSPDDLANSVEVNQTNNNDTSSPNLLSSHSNVEIYAFYIFGLLLYFLGVLSSLYVMLRTWIRWSRDDLTLNMTHKLPFYIASSDFFIYVVQIINLTYPVIYLRTWPGLSCKFVGASFFYFAINNMLLVGSLAILSYFRVCKQKYYSLGVLDFKLFIIPVVLPFILAIPGWNSFGSVENDHWCYSNDISKYIHIALLSVDMAILLISIYCYIGITYTINISRLQVDEQFLIALRKIVGYLFMFIIQWTPVMIYVLIDIKSRAPMWTFFVFFISLPLGGVLNCYRYITNEGWWVNLRGAATSSITSTYSSPDTPTSPPSPSSKTINRQQTVGDKHQDSYLVRMPEENSDGNILELKNFKTEYNNNNNSNSSNVV